MISSDHDDALSVYYVLKYSEHTEPDREDWLKWFVWNAWSQIKMHQFDWNNIFVFRLGSPIVFMLCRSHLSQMPGPSLTLKSVILILT